LGAYQEHGEVAGSDDGCARYNSVAGYGEKDQHADVDAAVACGAGGPGYPDGHEEGCEPDCRRREKCQHQVSHQRKTRGEGDLPGTVNNKVSILPNPSVCTMLGKKYWNV